MFQTPQLLWARLLAHSFLDAFCDAQLLHAAVFYASAVFMPQLLACQVLELQF